MLFSIRPNKSNTVTNVTINNRSVTGSNSGRSEILELFVLTSSQSSRGVSRVLLNFDISQISSSIASGDIPSSSVEYRLILKHAPSYETVPASFDVIVHPLSSAWDSGNGLSMYDEGRKDSGYSNWVNATSIVPWVTPGTDFISSVSASQHFDSGFEDLNLDISNIMNAFLTGGIPNNGIIVKFPTPYETGSQDFYVKKFFSQHAVVPERAPRLEARWSDTIEDDRSNIKYENSGSLFYYKFLNGSPQNVALPLYANILNSSSAVVQTLTASLVEAGIYQISGVFVAPTSSTKTFQDVWFNALGTLFTGTFTPQYATGSESFEYDHLDVIIPNIKSVYGTDERVIINVFGKLKDYKPAFVKSGSVTPSPLIFNNAYYAILNEETKQTLVDFSTGSVKYSKLSYDENGNYFELWTNSLPKDNIYRLKVLVNYNNQKIVFDKNWLIKISE